MRSIAAQLRELRYHAELNTRDAARKVDMSPATLNRLENGTRAVNPEEIAALLTAYDVTGVERERLLQLSREASLPGSWKTSNGALPKELPPLIRFEAEAKSIVHVSMLRVPGLLQTPDYILDEAVVRRPVGGSRVMAEQLAHVMECARQPHIDVRVLPFERGAHTGLDGTYVLLTFEKARDIVHLEHKRSSLFVDHPDDVAPFHAATDTLVATALGPEDSLEFLASAADDFNEG